MSSVNPNKLPQWLSRKMREHNLGVRELAEKAGIWPQTIQDLLNGEQPSFDLAVLLAGLFDVPPELILTTAGVPTKAAETGYFRELLLKETANMTVNELYDLLAYVDLLKHVKELGHSKADGKNG